MVADVTYAALTGREPELTHRYGPNFHILSDPFLLSHLGRLCSKETTQPSINSLVKDLYRYVVKAVLNGEFPRRQAQMPTRMADVTPLGVWEGEVIDPHTRVVTVNIARAGTLPSQVCYDFLNKTLEPAQVRQDHFIMARETDSAGRVTGTNISGSKIGGPVDGAFVLFPDPMGATGGSLSHAISVYKKAHGLARRYICLNLIVTPDFLRRVKADHPDVVVYAVRLDRGMSAPEILKTVPGTHWDQETGLTDKQYIVPGGGGFGEIMNNAYVSGKGAVTPMAKQAGKGRTATEGAEISVMLSPAELERRIKELGREISDDYAEGDLVLVSVLKGSFIFAADLCRAIEVPHTIDFLACSSYHNDLVSSGEVQLTHDLGIPVAGRDLLIVEDIVDTGLTLAYLVELLKSRHPRSLKVAALLDKPSNRKKQVQVDYVGFTIPNRFVIGFGLDHAGKYRNLPYIGVLEKA